MNIKALVTKPNIFGAPASAVCAPPPPIRNLEHQMTRRALWPLALLALFAICTQAQAQDKSHTATDSKTADAHFKAGAAGHLFKASQRQESGRTGHSGGIQPIATSGATRSAATTLTLGTASSGAISPAGNVDWWKFVLTATSLITVETTGATDTVGKLEDNAGATLDTDDDGNTPAGGGNFKIVRLLGAGTYFVRVAGYSSATTGNYSLTVSSAATSTATALTLGTAKAGAISPGGEVDYYRIALTESATIAFETTGSTDTSGLLHDSSGAALEANDDSGAGDNFRIDRALEAGTYYIRVAGFNPTTTGNYSLIATANAAASNTRGEATALTLGTATSGTISPAGDVDWWSFTLTSTSVVTIEDKGAIDTDGKLEDSAGATLATDDDSSASGTNGSFKIVRLLGAGTYYIRVSGFRPPVTGNYNLTVTAAATSTATALTLGTASSGTINPGGDVDYYRFTLPSASDVVIETTGSIDTSGLLHDSSGAALEANDDSGAGDNFRIDRALGIGTYYIRVAGFNPLTTGSYSLSATVTATRNTAPTGTLNITANSATATTWAEDNHIIATFGTVTDPDGIDTDSISWKWQQAAPVNDAPPADDSESWNDISGATGIIFTPLQAHVGNYVRACVTFADEYSTPETSTICTRNKLVVNVSDAPTGRDTTVAVPTTASSSEPHRFALSDFPIEDEDGDSLDGIRIATLPTAGTLTVVGSTINYGPGAQLSLEDLQNLAYYPDDNPTPSETYDSFTYRVRDNGNGALRTAMQAVTLTINLFVGANATGTPAVTPAAATEDAPITASQGTVEDPDNSPTSDLGTIAWQWSAAASEGGAYTDISGNGAATDTFTPQQAHVGQFLQVCASFTDSTDTSEQRCLQMATAVANVNDAPGGRVGINTSDNSASTTALTALTEGTAYSLAATTGGGTLADPDGLPTGTAKYIDSGEGISWQTAATANGPWTEVRITSDHLANGGGASYTPAQAQVDGYVRVCLFYRDLFDHLEGGDSSTAATRAAADSQHTCSTALQVANANDAPVARDHSINVSVDADMGEPYNFTAADFPFTDEDGDSLASITIESSPEAGTLSFGGGSIADGTEFNLTDLVQIVYYPAARQQATTGYATFTFNVTDDGSDGTGDKTSTNAATITINLIVPGPAPATGAPTVAASDSTATAHNEDVELAATTSGITDPNGIDTDTVRWQWQSAAAPATGTPADGDYSPIAGADEATFTPLQAQVGMYIRVCASFSDALGGAEGPLCSTGAQVANVNDAPTSDNSSVNVLTTATADAPYTFKRDDFPFMDEDGDSLASITIGTLSISTGTFRNGSAAAAPRDTVTVDNLGDLSFYAPAGTSATPAFATFTFAVNDGTVLSSEYVMTINLVPPGPVEASGQPAITGTAAQNATLTATRGTVADANGIDDTSIMWQWQQATAADSTAWAAIADATAVTFAPTQAQVAQYVRVCMTFMDNHSTPTSEGPLCSAATGPIADVNDPPMARPENTHNAMRADDGSIAIPVSAFMAAYSDPDGDDPLESVTITELPLEAEGTLRLGDDQIMIDGTLNVLAITNGEFTNGPLTLTMEEGVQTTTLTFTLNDGEADSNPATLTITLGSDIAEEQVTQISAILSVAAVINATNAISGAITAPATDLSLDGTSLMGAAQTLHQSNAPTNPHHAWYHSTTANWEYTAAHNAADNSRASLLNRLQSMANGDIALNYSLTDTSTMRFWARYQSLDINGNEGESLEYDGSGTGFYLGADNQITDTMRIGLAIGTDSSDISIDLDDDKTNAKDEATRSATSFYPYLHIDLGNNNQARVIAGFGSGTLDIKSTANSNSTASADLSWNMLAASISHHRPMKGNLSARFDGSLQLGNTSTDETTFTSGSTLMAGKSSANELTINAELRYQSNNITPFASLAARKLGGDISQSVALDMAFGADLQTNPANLRIAITRQINDTTHQRHSISLDASTRPSASGITASLGSRYDSITGKPQWQSTVRWQNKAAELSLDASPGDYRLRARLRW